MSVFTFKHFTISQANAALKVGTDAMLLGALIDCAGKKNALDIGAGTGVLSLMLAQKNQAMKLTAIEIDEASCRDCTLNFNTSPFTNELKIIEDDFLSLTKDRNYDLIVSNPPFYQHSLLGDDERVNRTKHADYLPIRRFYPKVAELLKEEGDLWLIFPFRDLEEQLSVAIDSGFFLKKQVTIFAKAEKVSRVVVNLSKTSQMPIMDELVIRNHDNSYSEAYKLLTKDYHDRLL